MSMMAMGTQLFMLITDPDNVNKKKVVKIDCPMEVNTGNDDVKKEDDTCLEAHVEAFLDGFMTPGDVSFTLGRDKMYESHILLYKMSLGDTPDKKNDVKWAIGLPDNKQFIPPVLNHDETDWILPDTREWVYFPAHVTSFPLDPITKGTKITATATLTRSDYARWSSADKDFRSYPDKYKLTPGVNPFYLAANREWIAAPLAANASDTDIKTALELLDNVTTATVTDKTTYFEVELAPKGVLTAVGADVEEA